jgi:hypothetical protein
MHNGTIVVRSAKVGSIGLTAKIVFHFRENIGPNNLKILIAIFSTLLVMETDGVTQFVQRKLMRHATVDTQGQPLGSGSLHSNHGPTSIATVDI